MGGGRGTHPDSGPGSPAGGGRGSKATVGADAKATHRPAHHRPEKKRKNTSTSGAGASGVSGSTSRNKKAAPPPRSKLWEPPDTTQPEPEPEPREPEKDADDDAIEVETSIEDPVELLEAQGVSADVAREMLAKAKGDFDAAVMLIVRRCEMEKEEKDLAAVMEESLKESEEEAAKRGAEDADKKRTAPAQYFAGSSFLTHLGEEVSGMLLGLESDAKEDVIAMLDFERQCKRWYRKCSREVDATFAAVAAELVTHLRSGLTAVGGDSSRGAVGGGEQETGDGGAAKRSGPGDGGSVELVHSMLVAHLKTLKEAVLAMPKGVGGGVPEVFSPKKDAVPEEIDLTVDLT